jgi:HEAT repeat protein
LPACWLEVVGFSPTEREQIETVLRRDLETPSYEQLLAWAADPAVRGGLMRAVLARRPRDTGALSTLAIAGLGDPNVDRRFEAASALALLGDRSCIGALRAAMHLEPDPGVQASLAQCLAELGE